MQLISTLMQQIKQLQARLAVLQANKTLAPISLSLSELGDKTLCYGQTVNITWDKDTLSGDSVDVLLQLPASTGNLDTVRTEKELYSWVIKPIHTTTSGGMGGTFPIEESDMYKIFLQTGASPNADTLSKFFTIKNCAS